MSQRDQKGVFWFILDCLREVEELENLDRSLDVDLGLPCNMTLMTECMHVRLVLEKCDLRIGSCLALPPRSSRLRITSQR